MKSGIFRIIYFSLVLANCFLIFQVQRVSSFILSPDKPNEIILSTNNPELKINITYLGLETVYDIRKSYSFFIPNVSVECDCKCADKHELVCTGQSHKRNLDCANLQNSTTTCTVYETEDKDPNVCTAYFKLCCQTYFSKSKVLESYTAFHLKLFRSIYKIRINSILEKRKDINVTGYNGANSFLLYPKIIMDVYNSFPANLIKEDWYYMRKNSREILHSPDLNTAEEINLNKLGWFQINNGETTFQRISLWDLEKQLRVKPVNCQTNPPTFDWNLNAKQYSRNNLLYLPEDGQTILDLFKNNIHEYLPYLTEEKIVFKSKIPHKLNISISNINEVNEKSFMYNCRIIVDKESKPKVHFIFFKGHGLFRMEVINSFLRDGYKFSLKVFNASRENPFNDTKTLPFNDYNSTLICVYWGKEQFCQLPQIVQNGQTQKQSTVESTPFITENNNAQEDDQKSAATDDNNIYPYKNLFIIITAFCVLEHIIYIVYHFWKKWKKRRKEPDIELGDIVTENTTAPLLTNEYKQTSLSTKRLKFFAWGKENLEFRNPCEEIVKELRPDVWKHFGKQIGFSDSELDSMVAESDENNWSFEERCHQMLKKFRKKFPNKFKEDFLRENLKECQLWYDLEKDPVALIREKLENYYRNIKAPHFSWMGDIHLNYDVFNFQLQHLQDQGSQVILSQNATFPPLSPRNYFMAQGNFKRTVPLHQIFEGKSEGTSEKILIEGQKGIGKTSLCLKLAYDWMNSKTYMGQFYFVFIINLGKLESNIENYLTKEIFNNEAIHLVQVLHSVKKKILFILDDYHELKPQHKKNVLELLSDRLFPNASILLTSDTKDYFIDKDLLSTPDVTTKCFQKIFNLMESSSDYREHILLHYVFTKDVEEKKMIINFLHILSENEQRNYLLLLLIGIVQKHEGLRSVLSSRTKFFTKLCNFIVESATKDGRRDSLIHITMNNNNSMENIMVIDSLMEIGKMCLNLLEEGRISFTEEIKMCVADQTVVKEFVCLNNPMCFNSEHKLYTFIDQVFVDYLAAYYLWCIRNTEEFVERIQSLRMSKLLDYKSQLFKFLSGLLGKHEYHLLLNAFKPFAFYFSFNFNGYLNTMKESLVIENWKDLFQHFLPVYLEIVDTFDNSTQFYDFLMSNSLPNKIKIIEWDVGKPFHISSKIKIEKLVLNVNSCISAKSLEICRLIQCEEVVCVLTYKDGMSLETEWNRLMEMMENLKTEWISFHISNSQAKICSLMLKEMKAKTLKNKKIRNLYMYCGLSGIKAFRILCKMIQKKEIESVFVTIFNDLVNSHFFPTQYLPENSQTVLDALIKSLSNNSGIKEFIFHNVSDMWFTLNVDELRNKGSKHFDLVWLLGNVSVECDEEITDREIKAFIVDSNKIDGGITKTILCKTKSLIIGSHLNVFHFLHEETPDWDPLQVKELDIYVTDDILPKNTFLYLKEFKNLKIFSLHMTTVSSILFDWDDDIVTVIQSLPFLETFEMINIECNLSLVSIITQKLMTFLSSHSSSNKTPALKFFRLAININVMKRDKINAMLMEFCSVMQQTVEPLKQHRLQEFSLLFYDPNKENTEFILSLADVFPLRSGFRIQWDLDGKKDGSTRIKCYYKYLFHYHRFSVSFSPESD